MIECVWKHRFVAEIVRLMPDVDEDQAIECGCTQVEAAWSGFDEDERGTPSEAAQATIDAMADML